MFNIKTQHRVTSIDTYSSTITRSTALWITNAPEYITDEALRERLFSEEYREQLKEYMLIYGGYHDMLLSAEEVSSEIISAEEE